MKDCLRSAQSRPCTTTFSLRRFLAPALPFFVRKWLFVAATLAFATACKAGYVEYDPIEMWQISAYPCLKDTPEETCQCNADYDAIAAPYNRFTFLYFTVGSPIPNPSGPNYGKKGYCTIRKENIQNPAVWSDYTTEIVQNLCPKNGSLSTLHKDGTLACYEFAGYGLSISLARVASRQSKQADGKIISLVARVKNASGLPVFNQDARLSLSLPGKLSRPSDPSPTNYITTDKNGEAFLEYTPGQTGGKTQVVTATCNPSGDCLAPVELKIKQTPVIGFFNGVWNTDDQALKGLDALKKLIGPAYQETELRYENFYNQTGTGNGNSALQDIAEVFIQRSKELDGVLDNRWEHYWELLAGKHASGDSLTARLLNGLVNGSAALANLFDATFNAMLGQMFSGYSQMLSNPPTAADVAAQLQKLRGLADEDHSFVLIAHSQGNLFVNSAYDGLRSSHPDTMAGVVHVAPASPTLRGEHLLADIDLVINGLRVQGIGTVAPININLPMSKSDLSGHTLVGTYLDATRAAREKIDGMVQAVLGKL